MFNYMKRGKKFYKNLFALALPIILQNLIMLSLGMIDTFMVGMLGESELAAVTVANTPVFVIQLLIFGLQSGSSVLISQYWGKQDKLAISRVVGIGFYLAGTLSTAFALVMWFFPTQAMSLFCNNAELVDIAAQYVRIVGFSYVFNSITGVYTGAHRGMENPKLGLCIFAVSMCINTFLNWVLIFGKLGAPALGVEGAAIATVISRVVEFIIMIIYAKCNHRFKMKAKNLLMPGREMLKKFLRYSTPVVLNETLWGAGTALYPTIMGHMANSTEILAAYTIAGNIDKLCTVAVFAVAATAAIIVGREIGKGHADEAYEVGAALSLVSFGMGLVTGLVMLALIPILIAPYVYPLFGLSPLACSIATMMQTVTFIFIAMRAFNSTNIVGVLRGGGDVHAATLIDVLPLWLVALPFAAICGLVFKLDILWVYLALALENVVKFFFGLHRFRSKKWINDL
ncbi:MAG: MATE family efflux transporter, partial [Oscillospiraceae bacterium]